MTAYSRPPARSLPIRVVGLAAVLGSLLIAPGGCSKILGIDDTTRGDGDAATADADPADPTVVTGRIYDTYIFNGQETEVARDLSAVPVEALLGDGIGGYTVRAATVGDNGTFTLTEIPEADYWLRVGSTYYRTARRRIELTTLQDRRPEVSFASTETPLALNIDGLAPWIAVAGSNIELSSPSGMLFSIASGPYFDQPSAGATTFAGEADYAEIGYPTALPLLQDDPVYVTQLGPRETPEALAYSSIVSYGASTLLTQVDGQRGTLTATLGPVTDELQATLDWKGEAFGALYTTMCPPGASSQSQLKALAAWGGLGARLGARSPALPVLMDTDLGAADSTHVFDFANPLPADSGILWRTIGVCGLREQGMSVRLAGYFDTQPFASSLTLTPKLGPPRVPLVDSRDGWQELVLELPLADLAWSRPSLGDPEGFLVIIQDIGDPEAPASEVARFYTPDSSLRLPAGVLEGGHVYALRLAALVGLDPLEPSSWGSTSTRAETTVGPIIVGHPPILFVDASAGDDSNRGTVSSPYRTIKHALSVAASGDEIHVAAGLYDSAHGESFPIIISPGVSLRALTGGPVTLAGGGTYDFDTATVVLEDDTALIGFVVDNDAAVDIAVWLDGSRSEVTANTISSATGLGTGLSVQRSADHVITGNIVTGHATGIWLAPTGPVRLEGNQITGNTTGVWLDPAIDGMDLGGGSAGSKGGNSFSCNTSIDIEKARAATVSAQDNLWDHVPPVTSTGSYTSTDDVYYHDASVGLLDTTGASLAASPCL